MGSRVGNETEKQASALSRAQYQERKSKIGALEAEKGQLKDGLDNQNAILAEAKAEARNLQRQIDAKDAEIAALKSTAGQELSKAVGHLFQPVDG